MDSSSKIKTAISVMIVSLMLVGALTNSTRADTAFSYLKHGYTFEENIQQEKYVEFSTTTPVNAPIFVYHSVRPHIDDEDAEQEAYDVTPELFDREMSYLKDKGYETVTMKYLAKILSGEEALPQNTKLVAINFDDGWKNQYTYALPILKKYNQVATFYVFTNPIGKKEHFLSWSELKEMQNSGMEIGSHTLSHPYLFKEDHESLVREITKSKRTIELELGVPVVSFASPFGYSNQEIEDIIKNAGYSSGRTTYKGVEHHSDEVYRLRSILVDDSFEHFKKTLEGK